MKETQPPIYFYIPQELWTSNVPENIDSLNVKVFAKNIPAYSWTLHTYLRLKNNGFSCELTKVIPAEGVIVAFRGSLPFSLNPGKRLLLVCIMGDATPHPYAQLQIVQNPRQTSLVKNSYFMPHWPAPGLIPRNPAHGDRFENVVYYGCPSNLAPELHHPAWQEQLSALGFRLIIGERRHWHDYSDVDVSIAVRSFASQEYINKPATKLYKAWHANVPAILSPESAYQAERRSELDYLEVTSPTEVILALKRLRDHRDLRRAMIENGQMRAEETQPAKLVERWRTFLTEVAVPAWYHWCEASNWTKQKFFIQRYLAVRENGIRYRMSSLRK